MENTIHLPAKESCTDDSLFLASSLILGAHRTARDVQVIVAALLRYALIGASITNSLVDLMRSTAPEA